MTAIENPDRGSQRNQYRDRTNKNFDMDEPPASLKEIAEKWASESANKALSPGERIKLIYRFSQEARNVPKQASAGTEAEIRNAFCEIYTDPIKGKKINNLAASRYLRLERLSPTVVDKIATHASGTMKPLLSMSHAVVLAEVGKKTIQKQLLKKMVSEGWDVRRLKKEVRPHRDLPSTNAKVRHKVLIGKLDSAAERLNELLDELTKSKEFLKTIDHSDRRSKTETVQLLKNFRSSLSAIDDKLEKARDIADQAARELDKKKT